MNLEDNNVWVRMTPDEQIGRLRHEVIALWHQLRDHDHPEITIPIPRLPRVSGVANE